MTEAFDLESLVHLEQTFYDVGHEDGFSHGRIHGLIEGRALGREKGFEMWEELGFYEGFALMWQAIYIKQGRDDERAAHHTRYLLDLIKQFPRALCSTLGVKPSLRAAGTSSPQDQTDDVESERQSRQVWNLETQMKKPPAQGLDF